MQTPGEGELLIHARSRHEAEVALAPGDTLHWALKVANQRLNVSVALLLTSEDGSLERSETLHDVRSAASKNAPVYTFNRQGIHCVVPRTV